MGPALPMLTDMALGISPAHADVSVVPWATHINKALGCTKSTDRLMASVATQTADLSWSQVVTLATHITEALGSAQAACVHMNLRLQSSLDHRQQHDLLWCLGPCGPLRKSNPESEPFLISGLHLCPYPGPS